MSTDDTLREQIRDLVDRRDIADLIHAYCYHFDRNEPDEVAALFTDDAVVDYSPETDDIIGAKAIAATIPKGLNELFETTSHHVSNIRITFDGADEARSVSYLYAWHRYRTGAPDSELWGQYHHTFRRTKDGWRISGLTLKAVHAEKFHRATMHGIGRR